MAFGHKTITMKTETQPQHTKGKLNVNLTKDTNPDLAIFCNGLQIATIEPLVSKDEMQANAKRIVKAVNMHDELIEGLKNIREFAERSSTLNKSDKSFLVGEITELLKL